MFVLSAVALLAARLTYIFYKVREVVLTSLISFLIGIALLVGGRRLFWLFVGALGFIAGLQLAGLFPQISEATSLIIGLVFGIVFAVLAIFLQRLAVGIAGFLAGGFFLTTLAGRIGLDSNVFPWVLFIIGGMVGVLLVMLLFDWALITFSSIAGALLILQSFSTPPAAGGAILSLLVIAGVIIQGYLLPRGIRRLRGR